MIPTRRHVLSRLAALALLIAAAGALSFGFLGWLHPAFDSFSHFRIHISVVLILMAVPLLVLRLRQEAFFAGLLGAAAIVATIGPAVLPGPGTVVASPSAVETGGATYRLLQINLRYDNASPRTGLSLIGRIEPDILTLNEVSPMWMERLNHLEAAYPYRLICPPPAHIGGVAILSKRPFAPGFEPRCSDRGAFGHVRLDIAGRIVDVAALHLGWPWPFEQPWQLPHLAEPLAVLGDTAILAGDFNAAPWSQTVRQVAAMGGLHILRGIGPTWLLGSMPDFLRRYAGLPIDQVLIKGDVLPLSVGTTASAGSDHLPVLLEFTLPPRERTPEVLHARPSRPFLPERITYSDRPAPRRPAAAPS